MKTPADIHDRSLYISPEQNRNENPRNPSTDK
jgi:hypothetical protein